ncbi:hypothetical protein R3X27_07560 [Tropicimonas sp. TH_r6]|uniref:hypothetical protein n=1 Tax=Tropicimonas sp. TH_r6 TaxID=3082085 RepID=UPI002952E91A|nr:hypothetical protein [Tropicimonas sp. TH_r6]MDV7142538.1 hypothetical protein [Tropicimonas sp. TH_r6]
MNHFALATSALLTLAIAAPALASDQLANTLGVEGQGFSTSELTQLKAAYDDGDAARINFLLESGGAAATVSTKGASASSDQLAKSLGVDASDYSRAELVALKGAMDEDDATRINAITSQAAANSGDTPEYRIQLGKSVGLDAMSNSRADLVHAHES